MRHVLSVIFGAGFTVTTCWATGKLLFHHLRISLRAAEENLLGSVAGGAIFSLLIFLLCCAGLARPEVFLLLGSLAIWLAFRLGSRPANPAIAPSGAKGVTAGTPALRVLFWAAFTLYAALYLSNSMAPEVSPDGVAYHLGLVARYYRQHGFDHLTTNMYGSLTQATEMLFLVAFAFGRHSAAATVHCLFLLSMPFLLRSFGERIQRPNAGLCAGMIVFLSPLAGVDGVSAYNDMALAGAAFSTFYLLEIWRERKEDALLIPVGLIAGFCFAIKYTGFVAILYAAAVILIHRRARPLLTVGCAAGLVSLPWLVKNALTVENPVSPFLSNLFRNPYIHVSFEQDYMRYFRTYDLPSLKPLWWLVTVDGRLGGVLGPIFLLAPLALLSLRTAAGRYCLLALVFFLLPYPNNIGARFLLPAAPFAAMGIALALDAIPAIPFCLVVMAAVLAWPKIVPFYSASGGGWRIQSMPWKEALRLRDADSFLFRRAPHVLIAREMDEKVPQGGRVWSSTPVAEAYTKRDILVNYQSAEGQLIQDMLFCAHFEDLPPTWIQRFTFPLRRVTKLRIAQFATSPTDIWSIGELQFYRRGRLMPASPQWGATAKPNPWDAWLALDGNPATRWKTWESIEPGMYFEVNFGRPTEIDRVEAHSSHDQFKIDLRLEDCDRLPCRPLEFRRETRDEVPPGDLRRFATAAVKSRGIGYLLIQAGDTLASDIYPDPARWGLRLLADRNRTRLYQIQ